MNILAKCIITAKMIKTVLTQMSLVHMSELTIERRLPSNGENPGSINVHLTCIANCQ